jgi:c(7)-type cytochrome triheme protein
VAQSRNLLTVGLVLGVVTLVWAAQGRNKVGGGYIVYPAHGEAHGSVVFSHLSHGKAVSGYDCAACHPTIPKQRGAMSHEAIHEGNACAKCHDGKTTAPKSQRVAPAISDCRSCHMPTSDSRITVDSIGDVPFSHMQHTGTLVDGKIVQHGGQSCRDCHAELFTRKNGLSIAWTYPHGTDRCGTCHNGETTSPATGKPIFSAAQANCRRCHSDPATGQPCRKGADQ